MTAAAAPRPQQQHSPEVLAYLGRIYAESEREHTFRGRTPEDVTAWQHRARPTLRKLIGLDAMEAELRGHAPVVELDPQTDLGDHVRQKGCILTEPNVRVPFWLLTPKKTGPFPLAITSHGHGPFGRYAGIAGSDAERQSIQEEERDVAVQAVRHGFLAIAPATRGIGADGVPDITGRHGGRDCRSQLVHCLLVGRTPLAERIWDVTRLLDWALAELPVQRRNLLVLGNSGGGMVAAHAAACDERIEIAIPSCCFTFYVKPNGLVSHCDCNAIPGILRFGEFYDVAGLIAPRHLLVVNGRHDPLHAPPYVDQAVARLRQIYAAAGVPDRFEHCYGNGGHRFFAGAMWPFVERAMGSQAASRK